MFGMDGKQVEGPTEELLLTVLGHDFVFQPVREGLGLAVANSSLPQRKEVI